eukprot:9257356-Alexandrium_andersonii.AAC.1
MAFRRQPTPTLAFFRQCHRQRPMRCCAAARGTVAMRCARRMLQGSGASATSLRFVTEPLFLALPCAIA